MKSIPAASVSAPIDMPKKPSSTARSAPVDGQKKAIFSLVGTSPPGDGNNNNDKVPPPQPTPRRTTPASPDKAPNKMMGLFKKKKVLL